MQSNAACLCMMCSVKWVRLQERCRLEPLSSNFMGIGHGQCSVWRCTPANGGGGHQLRLCMHMSENNLVGNLADCGQRSNVPLSQSFVRAHHNHFQQSPHLFISSQTSSNSSCSSLRYKICTIPCVFLHLQGGHKKHTHGFAFCCGVCKFVVSICD